MNTITKHDISLMSALLLDGMPPELVGEKFEIPASDVIQHVYPPNTFLSSTLVERRLKRGISRIGEDCIEKRCSRCHRFLPIAPEFWHNCRSSADGFLGWCRACEIDRANARRHK